MKLLQEFLNTTDNITYKLYELDCGIKLIHLQNPATADFDMTMVHKAGSIYEAQENVPNGTAHLLEHLFFKPNSKFKTMKEIFEFEVGTMERPPIYLDAATTEKFLSLRYYAQEQATDRVLERMSSLLDFTPTIVEPYLKTEKDIVVAEIKLHQTYNQNANIQKLKFLEGDVLPEFAHIVPGGFKDIEEIKIEDIKKFFDNRFVKENVVFSIQSKEELNSQTVEKLEQIGKKYPDKKSTPFREVSLENTLKLGYFAVAHASATALHLLYVDPYQSELYYPGRAERTILKRLINTIVLETIREKEGLVYEWRAYESTSATANNFLRDFEFPIVDSKLSSILESIDKLIFNELEYSIKSGNYTKWFERILSQYIFPGTISYDSKLPTDIARAYLEYGELYNNNKYTDELKKIDKQRFLEVIHDFQATPPHIWIESQMEKEEVENIVKNSSLWKRYSK